ncbi:hypothetical protein RRG08_026646 [Elysia crispata]|uniref:Uncharacterized protein n=1 Tax=Elysia crispata TaxID=231223 RepID=A0AAE1AZ97_9GAST|nr:hypothetical protein RRG08_026646 [Elysia crispata]
MDENIFAQTNNSVVILNCSDLNVQRCCRGLEKCFKSGGGGYKLAHSSRITFSPLVSLSPRQPRHSAGRHCYLLQSHGRTNLGDGKCLALHVSFSIIITSPSWSLILAAKQPDFISARSWIREELFLRSLDSGSGQKETPEVNSDSRLQKGYRLEDVNFKQLPRPSRQTRPNWKTLTSCHDHPGRRVPTGRR